MNRMEVNAEDEGRAGMGDWQSGGVDDVRQAKGEGGGAGADNVDSNFLRGTTTLGESSYYK